jgi:hypothetical protein
MEDAQYIMSGEPLAKIKTVGEEFIEWAEYFWKLNELKKGVPQDSEFSPYSIMRAAFIKQIE